MTLSLHVDDDNMEINIDNAEVVIEKAIKDGRIIGLTQWEGKRAKVVILED